MQNAVVSFGRDMLRHWRITPGLLKRDLAPEHLLVELKCLVTLPIEVEIRIQLHANLQFCLVFLRKPLFTDGDFTYKSNNRTPNRQLKTTVEHVRYFVFN